MTGKNRLYGPNSKPLDTHSTDDYGLAQVVYTRPRVAVNAQALPLINPSYGVNAAINAAFGGTPDLISNGEDTAAWTVTNVTGTKITNNSTDQAFSGTQSVKVNGPNLNDTWQFDKGSNLTVGNYVALTGKIYIDKDWGIGDSVSVYGWDTGTGLQVGSSVLIEDYINEFVFGEWQSITISFEDLGLTSGTIDSFRMEQVGKVGKSALWYLDVFQVEETGNSETFLYKPEVKEKFRMTSFTLRAISNVDQPTMLDYDKFFGITALGSGFVVRVQTGAATQSGLAVAQFSDITVLSNKINYTVLAGNTHTQLILNINLEVVLDGRNEDFIQVTVNDNLSSMVSLTSFIYGSIEDI